ncbi:MAG: aldose 1-epimerase family protein [Clostridia bacterium]|nr:aldose 1-epimerase family protein [Clostridia bacterium]
MKLFNKSYSKKELSRKCGNMHQIGGTRHYELLEGSAKGTRAIDINTGSGFHFTVLPDRGMDISLASYRGVNLVYQTPNGEMNPAFYNAVGTEWLRTFFAGLLTTCGLTYFGQPCIDQGVDLGIHGRYNSIPARNFCDNSKWLDDEYVIRLSGVVEESILGGDKVRMTRVIETSIGKKSFLIKDTIENFGSIPAPLTVLYHINAGFPLLDENAEFIISTKHIEPYDDFSKSQIKKYKEYYLPDKDIGEQNFLHTMACDDDGYAYAAVVNDILCDGLGLYIKFKTEGLPYLNQWKLNRYVDYVAAIEPCNTECECRANLREKGILPYINPDEVKQIEIEIGVLDGKDEILDFKDRAQKTSKDI